MFKFIWSIYINKNEESIEQRKIYNHQFPEITSKKL